jgi:hypothetical protein
MVYHPILYPLHLRLLLCLDRHPSGQSLFLPYHTPVVYYGAEEPIKENASSIYLIPNSMNPNPPIKRPLRYFTGFLGKELLQYIFYGIVIGLLISFGLINIYGYLILLGFVFLEVLGVIFIVRLRFGIWPFFRWPYFIAGVVLLGLGALSFIMQDWISSSVYVYVYSIVHSLWQLVSAIGQSFLIEARTYLPKPDIIELVKARNIDIDHMTAHSIDDITLELYGDQKSVRDSIRLRQHQRTSPFTVV